jgi:hypothetical protein
MDDMKDILAFIGFAAGRFFTNLVSYFGYLFLVVALTVPVFLIGYGNFHSHYVFLGFLVLLVLVNVKLRRVLIFKNQLALNMMFVRFLEDRENITVEGLYAELPKDTAQALKAGRERLKKEGMGFIPAKLLVAVAALQTAGGETFAGAKLSLRKVRRLVLGYLLAQSGIFLLALLPFLLVAFLFSGYMAGPSRILIYVLGVYFVYFLNAGILDPYMALLIQKRLYVFSKL